MTIFLKPNFILFCVFFSPVQLENYKLLEADFNMGDTVFSDDVYLSRIEGRTFEIKSSEGERTFCTWDFLTMLGSYVEFDTFNSKPQVRCIFDDPVVARELFSLLKPNPDIETKYPLVSLVQVFSSDEERTANNLRTRVIIGGTLVDEFRNRFIVYSQADEPVMVFSTGHFNVSSVLTLNRILLVIQAYDIEEQDIVMLKFLVRFESEQITKDFHKYVTKESPCTNSLIPINTSHFRP